jgi:hypothetical protein
MSSGLPLGPVLGLAAIAVPSLALAGAWTLPAGTGQAAVTGTWTHAERAFSGSGNTVSAPTTDKYELQGLFEYGVNDSFTVMLMPGLQHLEIGPPIDTERSGIGVVEFGGRHRLFHGPSWVMSAQATLRTAGILEPVNPAALGIFDPEVDIRVLFGLGTSVAGMPAFIDLQLAQRFRMGEPPNEFRADLSFGLTPWPRWVLWAQSFNVFAEGSNLPIFPRYSYHKLQLSIVHDLTPAWSLQLGGFATVAGSNALQENGLLLGTWYRF